MAKFARPAWGHGLPRAIGEAGTPLPLRSPPMLGAACLEGFGWDGARGEIRAGRGLNLR